MDGPIEVLDCKYYHMQILRFGILILVMRGRSVPFTASCDAILSVSYVETKRSELIDQRPSCARRRRPENFCKRQTSAKNEPPLKTTKDQITDLALW